MSEFVSNSSKWRFILGLSLFLFSFVVPLFIPLVVVADIPSSWKGILSGFLGLGAPEFFMLLAAVVLGKDGYNYLKKKSFALFKKYALPKTVGKTRHNIGITLFVLSIIAVWLSPYLAEFMPFFRRSQLLICFSADLIFLISLFVLGGDFWEKLKALFVFESNGNLEDRGKIG